MLLSHRTSLLLISIFYFTSIRLTRAAQCYWPDGSTADPSQSACNSTAAHSHCCSVGSTCLANGLCLSEWDTSLSTGACTDQTWADSSCFQQCLGTTGRTKSLSTLYRCDDNNWCCSDTANTTTCCPDQHYFQLPRNSLAQVQNGSAFVAGYTISAISTTSTALADGVIPIPPGQVQCSGSKNAAAVGAGTGVGIGIPLLAVIGSLVFLLRRQKQRYEQEHNEVMQRLSQEIKKAESTLVPETTYLVPEVPSTIARAELSSESVKK